MAAAPVLSRFRVGDVETFLAVLRLQSINGAARTLGVTPSQISKALARLEKQLGVRLLLRSPRGVSPSREGSLVLPELMTLMDQLEALHRRRPPSQLTVIGTSFLNACFLSPVAAALPELTIQSLQTRPGVPSAFAGGSTFDVAFVLGRERWPASWSAVEVGSIRKGLFCSPAAAARLGTKTTPAVVRQEVFIGPVYSDGAQTHAGQDGCPLPARERRFGHRVETAALALELACSSEQLVFAPQIAARHYLTQGQLVEIAVQGWHVRDPLFLICHEERVPARAQRQMQAAMRVALDD